MIRIFESAEQAAQGVAHFIAQDISTKKENYTIALSGGSTPKLLFRSLTQDFAEKISWQNVHIYWGDERMVPANSQESNYGEAKRILIDKISIPQENIHPINGLNDPDFEAKSYSDEIKRYVAMKNDSPIFDLILLGMGDDGHTASIFPNQMQLLYSSDICKPAYHPKTNQSRITLTGNTLNNAQKVVFMVTGTNKSEKISEIINKKGNYLSYPAAHIIPAHGDLFWFIDKEAAKLV